jgi:hypothetical protein
MTSWLVSMVQRKRVKRFDDRRVSDFRSMVDGISDEAIREAMIKDAHLTEAAIIHHLPVASHDAKQRRYISDLGRQYPLMKKVQWFSPEEDDLNAWSTWLQGGCKATDVFCCDIAQA